MSTLFVCLSNSRGAPAVSYQPRVVIRNWRVLRTENELHLAGFLEDGVTCRLTTAIAHISMPSRLVLTASGRTYELVGSPASDAAPLGVIALRVLQLGLPVQQDASNEIWSAMQSAMS